ncbi:MAG: BNR-4 repeat-containing protein [Planctomycetaceae bacterium]|nr:BNR-4 repeat-containing protein [Planctomycetaceae bacterium]
MKHVSLFLVLLFSFSPFIYAAPQGDGIVLDGTSGFTVKDFRLDGTSFSVSAWVKLKTPEDSQIFASLGAPGKDWTLYTYSGKVRMLVENAPKENNAPGDSYSFAPAPLPKAEQWTHYLGTYNGKTVKVYLDGRHQESKPLPSKRDGFSLPLYIGTGPEQGRCLNGAIDEVNIWKRAVSDEEAAKVFKGETVQDGLVYSLNSKTANTAAVYKPVPAERAVRTVELLNLKDDGYRGIWYMNQPSADEYVYKYSGGLGTYPANHYPFAVYAPEVNKTFFCYGGTEKETEKTLLHEVSYFDHKTGTVPRPTIILDKKTDDAHDNPVMNIDKDGYIWVFSTSHGTGRPSFVHKSKKPYDVSEFERINAVKMQDGKELPLDNFSYLQIYYLTGKGFVAAFTTYDKRVLNDPTAISARTLVSMSSPDGVKWSEWRAHAGIEFGHYQSTGTYKNEKVGSAFNYHPNDKANGRLGLNWRTNLYYIETKDAGKTWQNVQGETLAMPLREIENKALVHDYDSKRLNVYVFDVNFDAEGKPIIAYLTSKGYESGPKNDPRQWYTAYWTGKQWEINPITDSDNNYDFGSIYVEDNNVWRIIGTDGKGPQEYNTGGEVSMWVSKDSGMTWVKERQLTQNSELNHCYPRRPVNAHPDFYAIWATGHGRKKSESTLYFCNKKGDVFELPRLMDGETAKPALVK